MSNAEIPGDIRNFILSYVDSIAYMEALMLLSSDSEVAWDCLTVANRLYISGEEARRVLRLIQSHGFIMENNGIFRYSCHSDERRRMVGRLAQVYARQLIPVTDLIHRKDGAKVQQFADAFKLRKDK